MIEAKIDELILALNNNTEALLGRGQIPLAASAEAPKKGKKGAAAPASETPPAPPPEAPASEPVKDAAATVVEPSKPAEPTIQDLRSAAQAYLDAGGEIAKLKEINAKYGQKKIGDTAPDKIAEVLAIIVGMTPAPKA